MKKTVGEIDSLFVQDSYRKTGLGDRLIEAAEKWLSQKRVQKIHISVAQGNEGAFGFYNNHDYQIRYTVLEKPVNSK